MCVRFVDALVLKAFRTSRIFVNSMLRNGAGKLMIYTSSASSLNQNLISVQRVTEKLAQQLNLDFEIVRQTKGFNQIYVYYENGNEDPIPLYCNEGKSDNQQEILSKIRNMIFVLSFHPKHAALRQARNTIMTLS